MAKHYDVYKIPIRYPIVTQIGGDELTHAMRRLKTTHILDINEFARVEQRYPAVGSIFLVANAEGSYDFVDTKYGNICVYNGGLSRIGHALIDEYSEGYYELHFGKPMMTKYEFKK